MLYMIYVLDIYIYTHAHARDVPVSTSIQYRKSTCILINMSENHLKAKNILTSFLMFD
jgi:hypothetical protein